MREHTFFEDAVNHYGTPEQRRAVHHELESELRIMESRLISELRGLWNEFRREGMTPTYSLVRREDSIPSRLTPKSTFKEFDEGIKPIRGGSVDLDEEAIAKPKNQPEPPIHDPFDTIGYVDRIVEANRKHTHEKTCFDIRDCRLVDELLGQ